MPGGLAIPALKGEDGWVQPGWMYANSTAGGAEDTLLAGKRIPSAGLRHQVWYYNVMTPGVNMIWRTPPQGLVAVATRPNTADSDPVLGFGRGVADAGCLGMTTQRAVQLPPIGEGGLDFWLHTWSRGAKRHAGGGTDTKPTLARNSPSAADPGYVWPYGAQLVESVNTSGPNGTNQIRLWPRRGGMGLRHRTYFFSAIDANDIWERPNGALVVDCAWQSRRFGLATDQVRPLVLEEGRAIQLTGNGTGISGWLHIWTH